MAYFEIRGLTVGYGRSPLIRDIDLRIEKGEIVTLIGPNGGGKTTILKSLTRHLEPLGGCVYLDGRALSALSGPELARRLAVVFTDRVRPELLTCWDVAASGRYPYTGRMGRLSPEDRAAVAAAMEAVRVLELADRPFLAVSDGQRQRLLLARALCQQPEVIVLDEPTSYLDVRHKLELLDLLRTLAKREGITVLMSLHELDLAQKVSDKLVCVHGDRIAGFGPPEELLREETVRGLYGLERGSYDPLFGSVELPRPEGEPEVFVLCGCGTGVPVFRRLQKEGTPFAAGILYENDLDFPVARALAAEVGSERPFRPVSEAALARAEALLARCPRAVVTGFPVGPCNENIRPLLERAGRKAEG